MSSTPVKTFEQRVADVLDYDFDFYAVLRPGVNVGTDVIESALFSSSPAGLTVENMTMTDTVVKVFCRGGTLGVTYTVWVSIESVEGRKKTLEMKLKIV